MNRHGPRDCEKAIGISWLLSGQRQHGEKVACPECALVWVHDCDEAEGCAWFAGEEPNR